ncbi:hypothetical protein EDB81DRAFT_846763 [Dactylonectria macrodidyma]|uniref:TAM domain methyltransferase n=1 Tax=Dactylonectria macrodidyma TaxID=307937 RepID=A0A9P9DUS8_9HYPO|nr:hypothetical protein EDB81DRAFT_846763 [Dactylonectria macrodidyma]
MAAPNLGQVVVPDDDIISSSIIDYRRENGRTYHPVQGRKKEYSLPNDAIENDRLDLEHHFFIITYDDKLGQAPPNHPDSKVKRVLDVGTGTGIWAMGYADEHPEGEDWNYTEPFDYTHSRMMTMSVGNWKEYIQKAFE